VAQLIVKRSGIGNEEQLAHYSLLLLTQSAGPFQPKPIAVNGEKRGIVVSAYGNGSFPTPKILFGWTADVQPSLPQLPA
jgi:hypothetical protein